MARLSLVAGVDCSTQATKVVVVETATGRVVRAGRAAHPAGTEVDPRAWWTALAEASAGLLEGVSAISVAAQQHGLVTLDGAGAPVRPALLWNDLRSAGAARDLVAELGGPQPWADAVGSVPLAAFTVAKLRWLAEHEPAAADRVATVALPHDYLTGRLRAPASGSPGEVVTDRGDASGTGYYSARADRYREDLVVRAFGRLPELPRVLGPREPAGQTAGLAATIGVPAGLLVGPGTGDNMAAALGVGARPGDVVVSIGTSGTTFAVHDTPSADSTGAVAGFADATGGFLPLVCTLNASRVLEAVARLLGTDLGGLDALALRAPPGAGGLVLLPYLDGERTPDRPAATGHVGGLRRDNASPENLARAAVEGVLCGLAEALDALSAVGVVRRRVLLVGGGAASAAVQAFAPAIFGTPVALPAAGEYVALGAARQAAWVLSGAPEPPGWAIDVPRVAEGDPTPGVRAAYAVLRDHLGT